MRKITLKDVARDAGVSVTIASFAINNVKGRVSAELQQRVLESSKKLGYIPNSTARNLRTNNINTIVLMYDQSYLEERDASPLQFVAGALKHATDNGKDILLRLIDSNKGWENAVIDCKELWMSKKAEGIIFLTSNLDSIHLNQLKDYGVNFVVIPPVEKIDGFNSVYIDNFNLMSKGMELINKKGYKEVYFLTMKNEKPSEREKGFQNALKKLNMAGKALYYEHSYRGKGELWELLKDPIENKRDKIAIACWNDVDAINVIDILHSMNIKIPDEVGVLGFDDLPSSEHTQPPLTTIRQPFDEMARIAVDLIIKGQKEAKQQSYKCVDAGGVLIERASL